MALCPMCKIEMKDLNFEHIEFALCEKCHGIWFDKDSFPAVLKFLENDPTVPYDKYNPFSKKIQVIDPKVYTKRTCPKCNGSMEQFNYAYDSNIFLDKCSKCSGIWADKGEVLKVAIYLKGYPKLEAIGEEMMKDASDAESLKELSQVAEELKASGGIAMFLPKIILPLSDDNPRIRIPFMTIFIIVINVIAFIFEVKAIISGGEKAIINLAVVPAVIASGRNLYSLITSMFLHGGVLHLFFNMFFFWIFGDNVEDYLGHFRFLFLYLLFGICGSLLFVLTSINTPLALVPAIGASGAISGVMAAYFLIYPKARINILFFSKIIKAPAFLYIIWYILMQILFVSVKLTTGFETVAYSDHLGGIISALIIVFIIKHYRKIRLEQQAIDNE